MDIDGFRRTHVVVHHHLEKTGGTSLNAGLRDLFGKERLFTVWPKPARQLSALEQTERDEIAVLTGHFPFRRWDRQLDRKIVRIACVRDPFDRFRSFYHFVKARPNHPDYPRVKDRTFNEFTDWSLSKRTLQARGYLSRYLAGSTWRSEEYILKSIERNFTCVVPVHEVTRLTNCLRSHFEMPPARKELRRNVARTVYERDDSRRAAFMDANKRDYAILRFVTANYERWLESLPERIAAAELPTSLWGRLLLH